MCCTVLLLIITECSFSLQVMAHSTPQGILDDVAMVCCLILNRKANLFKLTFLCCDWLFEPHVIVYVNLNSFFLSWSTWFSYTNIRQRIITPEVYLKLEKYVLINKFLLLDYNNLSWVHVSCYYL